MRTLGLDTSNYTTSAAVFDGRNGRNSGKLLAVRPGEKGLRQSEALFQHVKELPCRLEELREAGLMEGLTAVAASTRPRAVPGSYMPCFLAGENLGRSLAVALGIPFFSVSHQQGHLAAAAWAAGRMELLDAPFLAWHLSGGTTELLYVEPDGADLWCERMGGTTDISAGQLIDRAGVLLGLEFPAGKALDALSQSCAVRPTPFRVRCEGFEFSLSGMENRIQDMVRQGSPPQEVAAFTLDTVSQLICRVTAEAKKLHPRLPVLCSGGVASNTRLRTELTEACGAVFAPGQYSTDNALGVAVLGHRLACKEKEEA